MVPWISRSVSEQDSLQSAFYEYFLTVLSPRIHKARKHYSLNGLVNSLQFLEGHFLIYHRHT